MNLFIAFYVLKKQAFMLIIFSSMKNKMVIQTGNKFNTESTEHRSGP